MSILGRQRGEPAVFREAALAWGVGLLDGGLFFVFWATLYLADRSWGDLVPILFLLPVSALVVWRGAVLVRQLLAGQARLGRAAKEGFKAGVLLATLLWLRGLATAVLAAGWPFDGPSLRSFPFWLNLVASLLLSMGLAGFLGAVHGAVFYVLNRWLLGCLGIRPGPAGSLQASREP